MTTPSFDASWLRHGYAFLDDCPEHLLHEVVTLPVGTLEERVAGVLAWREALLAGRLPDEGWPPTEIGEPARQALAELGILRFCAGQPELVDALLKDLVDAWTRRHHVLASAALARLRELEAEERARREAEAAARARAEGRGPGRVPLPGGLPGDVLALLDAQARRDVAGLPAPADGPLRESWGPRVAAWTQVADVFGDLGALLGRGWDLAKGVLRRTGWQDLERLRALMEGLPELRDVVRTLGRLQDASEGPSVAERILGPVRRVEEERVAVLTPRVPPETHGVERSGAIARMLPVEALMLGHPTLKYLWHARRAEEALLTYRVRGVQIERRRVEREVEALHEVERPRPERGPVIAVVDTSGSMTGQPEQIAKALVLEAVRTAHAEKRRCLLFLFGGPGEVVEHELDVSEQGIPRLLAFLGQRFGGGTDGTDVVRRVAERLQEQAWARADVLFVSDGIFGVDAPLRAAVEGARKGGTRFHGVQIGGHGKTGLHEVCDPVHAFADWASLGGWR